MIHKLKNIFKRKSTKSKEVRISKAERMDIIEKSSKQVSRGVFYSTVIIITAFLPVFMLTGQEGGE